MRIAPQKLKSRKAIFLDRDGTIIKHVDLLHQESEVRLLPGVQKAIKKIRDLGYLIIIVTNQSVIARGIITCQELELIHEKLKRRLAAKKAHIDEIYYCPHHPEAKLPEYRKKCRCRKPNPGMLHNAIRKNLIDPKKSFMVGDALIDIAAGQKVGVKTILVKSGPGHESLDKLIKTHPDFIAKNLEEAVKIIKNHD